MSEGNKKHAEQAAEFDLELAEPLTSDQHAKELIEEWSGIHSKETEAEIDKNASSLQKGLSEEDPTPEGMADMTDAIADDAARMGQQENEDNFREDFGKEIPDNKKAEVVQKIMEDGSDQAKDLLRHLYNFRSLDKLGDKVLEDVKKHLGIEEK